MNIQKKNIDTLCFKLRQTRKNIFVKIAYFDKSRDIHNNINNTLQIFVKRAVIKRYLNF